MPAAIRPYSMAVAPDSFLRNATIFDIWSLVDSSNVAPKGNTIVLRSGTGDF
jgi:hypothetical protein